MGVLAGIAGLCLESPAKSLPKLV